MKGFVSWEDSPGRGPGRSWGLFCLFVLFVRATLCMPHGHTLVYYVVELMWEGCYDVAHDVAYITHCLMVAITRMYRCARHSRTMHRTVSVRGCENRYVLMCSRATDPHGGAVWMLAGMASKALSTDDRTVEEV